jgi:hypothetical protein
MTASRRIRMSELIDQNDLGPAGDNGIEVHFLKPLAPILDAPAWNDFETLQERFGFLAAMSLNNADEDVVTIGLPGAGLLQHLVGLADAGRRAHENPELADSTLFLASRLQQGFGRRTLVAIAPFLSHS